jgi:hypothetical protein
MLEFDEAEYREEFLKRHRGARGAPGDLMARYAITLPATDAEVARQVRAVRAYWNKVYTGKTGFAQVAKVCRAEDERLRAEHGAKMETRAWWQARQSDAQQTAEKSISVMADDLRQRFQTLGVVTSAMLGQFGGRLGLTAAQANQAAQRAGLAVIDGVSLPEAAPIGNFDALAKAMAECAAPSVPELVHPGSGTFRLVERYECLADPRKRLDAVAVEAQRAGAEKLGISATDDARRKALTMLSGALRAGVDLRDVALYQMVTIAQASTGVSIGLAANELRDCGLEARDAAIVAVLVAERGGGQRGPGNKVPDLLAAGRLREARAAAMSLPPEAGARDEAMQLIEAAQRQLDQLMATAKAALAARDEARAAALLKDAARISAEDAATELAAVPLPPPADVRAAVEGNEVRLFWRPASGHDPDTVYAVRRTPAARPIGAPSEGEPVFRDRGDQCADPRAPVARPLQYAVFALGVERPSSRPAAVSMTALPAVANLTAEVGTATVALRWTAHPDAEVRVTRAAPGGPVPVPVSGSGCQVSGLTEGQPQLFEVTAVYRGPDGAELRSAPERITATPRAQARPISTLRARPVGTDGAVRVRITWVPVDNSDVKIVLAQRELTLPFGKIVSLDEMRAVGPELTGTVAPVGRESGFEAELAPGVHRLVPFSVGGAGIVVGKLATVAVTDPVRHLTVTPFAEYATVSWQWPANAQIAEVSWRVDGEEDVRQVDQGQYRSTGGFRILLGKGPCHIEVRAVIAVAGQKFTSPPVTAEITSTAEAPVRYAVSNIGPSIGPLGGRKKKVVFTAEQPCSGVRVVMVARQGPVMPISASDGVPILDVQLPPRPGAPGEFKATVPSSIRKPFWVRCFVVAGPARLIDPPISSLKET